MTATIKDCIPLAQDIYRNTYGAVTELDPAKWQWALDKAKEILEDNAIPPAEDQVQTPYPSVINRVYEFLQEFKDMHDRVELDEDETILAILPYLNLLAESIDFLYIEDRYPFEKNGTEDIQDMVVNVICDVLSDSEDVNVSADQLKENGYDKLGGDIHNIRGSTE